MSNEIMTRLKQAAYKFCHPPITYPDESIDPLLTTHVSFSDFLKPSRQSLLDQQAVVNSILPSINNRLVEQIPGLEKVEQEVEQKGKTQHVFMEQQGWAIISYENDMLTTSLSDCDQTGQEYMASKIYTIARNTKTKKTQIEIKYHLKNGANFSFTRTFEGGYGITYSYEDRQNEGTHEMWFHYDKVTHPNGPDVTFYKKRPTKGDGNNINEVNYLARPTSSIATGILSVNDAIVDNEALPPYDFATIFTQSGILLKEVTDSLHLTAQR